MNSRVLRLCAWSGIASLVFMGAGFVGLARFVPPPAPDSSAHEIARLFTVHADRIRFGMILTAFGAALLAPYAVAMTIHLRRIEGRHSALAWIVLAVGSIFILEFIYLVFFWQAATFRSGREADTIRLLNDMGWIPWVGIDSTLMLHCAVFGLGILLDRRARPIFPRWLGYYNLWAALMFIPGMFNVFFKTGVLAWNGLLAWYVPLVVWTGWMILNSVHLAKAVDHLVEEEGQAHPAAVDGEDGSRPDVVGMAAEIARLRKEMDALAAGSR